MVHHQVISTNRWFSWFLNKSNLATCPYSYDVLELCYSLDMVKSELLMQQNVTRFGNRVRIVYQVKIGPNLTRMLN